MILSWSGGKDAALALWYLQQSGHEVQRLMTTVSKKFDRILMHGVRRSLLEQQAKSIGLPLDIIYLDQSDNRYYEEQMKHYLSQAGDQGINSLAFGDIFLEDIRNYRESRLKTIGMKASFPLWKKDTSELIDTFIYHGFRSIICATDKSKMKQIRPGMHIDSAFKRKLPKNVDPCGENGEFHSFCYQGPVFSKQINFNTGVTYEEDYYNGDDKTTISFIDLLPV